MRFFKIPTLFRNALVLTSAALSVTSGFAASKTPELLSPYLTVGKTVKGEIGLVMPPKEISKYISKIQAAAKANPEWYVKFSKEAQPGLPLPWEEKLGLTKEEYDEYLKLWDQRKFKALQQVVIRLEESKPNEWMIRVSGAGMQISLLRYIAKEDYFKSPNGELKRLPDINADKRSIFGEWKGQEWKYESASEYITTKENIAIGKFVDDKYCLLIYRMQAYTSGNTLEDKSFVIRFAPPTKK